MEYLLTASQMQRFDQNTITNIGIPSAVLMERAALAVTQEITERFPKTSKILVISGKGNNGGDGLAIARLLLLLGYNVDTYLAWDATKPGTEENTRQLEILKKYRGKFIDAPVYASYDLLVDALFGIGLSGPLRESYEKTVCSINQSGAYVVAVDIPSGINTDTGEVLGCAVKADLTVTFGAYKKGHFLYPGSQYCGEIIKKDVGIYTDDSILGEPHCFTILGSEVNILPERSFSGNKGTFGKLLIIAGSKEIAGAAVLAAKAAFAMGVGMVRVLIHKEQKDVLLYHLPECMVDVYEDDTSEETLRQMVEQAISWSNGILIGPGLGTGKIAKFMLQNCLEGMAKPLVLDADALNIIGADKERYFPLIKQYEKPIVMTPHMGEFTRLLGVPMEQAKEQKETLCREFAKEMSCTIVCKDARSYVASGDAKAMYINVCGNDGMATAGSGDVLSGITAVLCMQEKDSFNASVHAVYLHGKAGDLCADNMGKRATKASDLADALQCVVQRMDKME